MLLLFLNLLHPIITILQKQLFLQFVPTANIETVNKIQNSGQFNLEIIRNLILL